MPPVRNQADLHRHWRALMGELGFAQSRLYLQFFTLDGRCTPLILDITERKQADYQFVITISNDTCLG